MHSCWSRLDKFNRLREENQDHYRVGWVKGRNQAQNHLPRKSPRNPPSQRAEWVEGRNRAQSRPEPQSPRNPPFVKSISSHFVDARGFSCYHSNRSAPPSSSGPGRGPLKAKTWVRVPLGALCIYSDIYFCRGARPCAPFYPSHTAKVHWANHRVRSKMIIRKMRALPLPQSHLISLFSTDDG
jgi:hypothetical protein